MTDDIIDRLNGAYEWRFTAGGTVVHALRKAGDNRALCGVFRHPSSLWMGTGTQDEYETAAALPECGKCCEIAAGKRFGWKAPTRGLDVIEEIPPPRPAPHGDGPPPDFED